MYRGLSLSSEAMEAPRILPALAWTFLIQAIFTQVALVEGHPPPPPATRGNFSTKSQRQQQHAIDIIVKRYTKLLQSRESVEKQELWKNSVNFFDGNWWNFYVTPVLNTSLSTFTKVTLGIHHTPWDWKALALGECKATQPSKILHQNQKPAPNVHLLSWPNSHYYQRLCQTSNQGLAVVTDGLASDAALERTAWTLDMMMQVVILVLVVKCRWQAKFVDNGLLCGGLYEGGRLPAGCDGPLPQWNGRCWGNWSSLMTLLKEILFATIHLWIC